MRKVWNTCPVKGRWSGCVSAIKVEGEPNSAYTGCQVPSAQQAMHFSNSCSAQGEKEPQALQDCSTGKATGGTIFTCP